MSHDLYVKLALASVSALALSGAAFAQAPAAEAKPEASGDIIVVTATRRAESLQDVPLAVSAISAEDLAESGFQNLTDIQYQFAGVQFGNSPNDAGFRLRGVGTAGGFSSSSEANVATVVDGVVIPFGNPMAGLGDLERVEVLKGPQGTQFGKNASSGVVNLTTKRPELNRYSGKVFASYAELNEISVNGAVNVPLGDSAAIRTFVFHRQHDGYVENVVRNEDWGGTTNYGFRSSLLWQPSDALDILITGDWSQTEVEGPGQVWTINRLPSFANPLMAARFGNLTSLGITPGFDNEKSAEEYPGYNSEQNYGVSAEINYDLGGFDLTSITAYRVLDQDDQQFAIDGSSVAVFTAQPTGVDQTFLSEEIRLSSPSGERLEYTTGVYLSRRETGDEDDYNRAQLRPAAPFNPFIVNISGGQSVSITKSDSAAVFFDGKLSLTDELRILGGLRYQFDKVEAESYSIIDPAFPPSPPGPPVAGRVNFYTARPLATGEVEKGDWSGRTGLEYEPNEDLLFFGTVARGYLGPTVTFSGLTGTRVIANPQTVTDVTIGVKSQFFDRRVTFNASAFHDVYKDMQTSVFNGLEFLTENAGGFEATGFEFDASWLINDLFSVNGSYTYSDTEFTDYLTACPAFFTEQGTTAVAANCNAPGSTTATPLFQAAGEPLNGAPKHSFTFGVDYEQPIGDSLLLNAALNYYYRSEVQYYVGNPLASQDAYDTVGLNLGLGEIDGKWRLSLFARNLFDTKFHAAVITLPFADAGGYVNWNTRDGRRTVGVSLEAAF